MQGHSLGGHCRAAEKPRVLDVTTSEDPFYFVAVAVSGVFEWLVGAFVGRLLYNPRQATLVAVPSGSLVHWHLY